MAPPTPRPTLRREWLLLGISLLLLAAIVAPPLINLGRYQHRIIDAMSRSLGRPVTMRAVTLRLLPIPALVLTDVIVDEAPQFGTEPALLAPSVVAQLRLTSLWRGQFEVSRVEVSDASLNLVRDSDGRWNVGSVLLQASHLANAPTGQPRPGPAPRFPYIEIADSRVNVKDGAEKLPYSLQNANLSMWLAAPDLWQLRLEAQPVRTDIELGLSDTGILHVEGTLHRATALGHMPLALHADWANAPLGQASRLLLGRDGGWRGDLHATADASGELDSLAIKTHVTIGNLHREEFTPFEPFPVDVTCSGAYSRAARAIRDVDCHWPVGSGRLLLGGNLAWGADEGPINKQVASGHEPGHEGPPGANLALTADQLPASFLVAAAGLTRSDFAPSLRVAGVFSGTLSYSARPGQAPLYGGALEASQLSLLAGGLSLPLGEARLTASSPAPTGLPTLELTAAHVDLGGSTPVALQAQLNGQGLLLHASGSASLSRLEELGRPAGMFPASLGYLAAQGFAEFDITRSMGWQVEEDEVAAGRAVLPGEVGQPLQTGPQTATASSATEAVTNGWLRLRNAKYAPDYLPDAVLLPSAQATFLPGEVAWTVPAAIFHRIPVQLAAQSAIPCNPLTCTRHFQAVVATLDAGELEAALLGAGSREHLLDNLLGRLSKHATHWPALVGTVHAETFTLGRLALRGVSATLSITGGQASLDSLDAQTLGGTVHSHGTLTLDGWTPTYALSTVLSHASAAAAGNLFHEDWGTGQLTFSTDLRVAGSSWPALAASAKGPFHAEWTHGGLGTEAPLARFAHWTGGGFIGGRALTFTRGMVGTAGRSAGEQFPVTGSIGFDRSLALQMGRPGGQERVGPGTGSGAEPAGEREFVTVTGTLSRPVRLAPSSPPGR